MYTRIVSFTVHSDRRDETLKAFHDKIRPALQSQPGFTDFVVLQSNHNPNEFLSVTFWKNKEESDRYGREQYQRLLGMVKPYIAGVPELREYNVDTSTFHRISAGKAA